MRNDSPYPYFNAFVLISYYYFKYQQLNGICATEPLWVEELNVHAGVLEIIGWI